MGERLLVPPRVSYRRYATGELSRSVYSHLRGFCPILQFATGLHKGSLATAANGTGSSEANLAPSSILRGEHVRSVSVSLPSRPYCTYIIESLCSTIHLRHSRRPPSCGPPGKGARALSQRPSRSGLQHHPLPLRSTTLRMPSALPPALVPDRYSTIPTIARGRDASFGPRRPARRHSRAWARAFAAPSGGMFAIRP